MRTLPPETRAFVRWQAEQFLEVERRFRGRRPEALGRINRPSRPDEQPVAGPVTVQIGKRSTGMEYVVGAGRDWTGFRDTS